ncbi:MAG: NfeD family protein [Acidiferrobacterales bacterium]
MCHLILMMPVLGLPVFWLWPMAVAAPVYTVIIVLSALLYFFTLRAMRRPVLTGSEELLRSIGEVVEVRDRLARVRVHSEIWNAESSNELRKGDRVKVLSVDGLTLRVQRLDASENITESHQPG